MNTYKHAKTGEAIKALLEYHNMAETLKEELEQAKKRYSPEVYEQKQKEAQDKFLPFFSAAKLAIDAAAKDMKERGEKAALHALSIGSAEEDFKMLSLPVNLSPDELRMMLKRNEGNVLFARAVGEYAQKHNYNGADCRDLSALRAHSNAINDALKLSEEFERILSNYLVSDKLSHMAANWQKHALERVDAEGLFVEY